MKNTNKKRSAKSRAVSRRGILQAGIGAAALAPFATPMGRLFAEETVAASLPGKGQAKQVVILFMNGGASHFETFDPKPGTEAGGPTKAIRTNVTGVHIADSLPMLAQRMDKIALLRGMSSREGNHQRARYLMHTGYAPNPTVVHPSIGATLSHQLGSSDAALPHYIAINGPGAPSGFLGVHHQPFQITVRAGGDARNARRGGVRRSGQQDAAVVRNMEAPGNVDAERRDKRLALLDELNDGFTQTRGERVAEAQSAMFERATRLMDTPQNTAFDLAQEPQNVRDAYGMTPFGQGVLMARRLLEEGVTCVEVNLGGWDTHDDNFNRCRELNSQVDRAASALLDELAASGRLDETLVVWLGDFGRTPRITASEGRGHYPRAWSSWFAGGGVQGGRVYGKTSADGSEVTEGIVTVPEFFGSIAHATGMDPETLFFSGGRPIKLVDEGGAPLKALFEA